MNVQAAETRVALLEEEVLTRESLACVLRQSGRASVNEYAAPTRFLSSLEVDKPAVAIVGLAAPWALSIVAEARQFHPDVRLLALARSHDPATIQRVFEMGAFGYLDRSTASAQSLVQAVVAIAGGSHVYPGELMESVLKTGPTDEAITPLRDLSPRERQVLRYLAAGADNLKISVLLKISERTVKAHVSNLYRKLAQENRTQLALFARQLGIHPPHDV